MSLELGEIRVDLVPDGTFKLDGGAMFGVVPRPVWERRKPPDERGRIHLALNCLLVQSGGQTILVDTGIGDHFSHKQRDIYAIDRTPGIGRSLADLGLAPEAIDTVIITHLHFDHAGGATRRLADGRLVPTFPNARYVVQRGHLEEEARERNELRRASYLPHTYEPIAAAGRFELVEGDAEIAPGVSVLVTGGHQRYHQAVMVRGGGRTVFYPADLIPTAAHVQPPFIMAYDHYPLDTLATKKRLLAQAAAQGWIVVLEHETDRPVGEVVAENGRFGWRPLGDALG